MAFDMHDISQTYSADMDDVTAYAEELYSNRFSQYFSQQEDLAKRLKSAVNPISDEELSQILIDIPLKLYSAAEELNKFRLQVSVLQLKESEEKQKYVSTYNSKSACGLSKSDWIKASLVDIHLMQSIYNSVIQRVENQISYTRELIMGAKKIWDARRNTEKIMPVGEVQQPDVNNLPDYHYIK